MKDVWWEGLKWEDLRCEEVRWVDLRWEEVRCEDVRLADPLFWRTLRSDALGKNDLRRLEKQWRTKGNPWVDQYMHQSSILKNDRHG